MDPADAATVARRAPLRRALDLCRAWNPFGVYPGTIIVFGLHLGTMISLHVRRGETLHWTLGTSAVVALSLLPSLCLFQILHVVLGRRRLALVAAELGLLVLYALLALEHLSLRSAPTLAMLAPAPVAFLRRELHWMLSSTPCITGLIAVAGGVALAVSQELLWRMVSRWPAPRPGRRLAASAAVYAALVLAPWHSHDEVASFLRSAIQHLRESSASALAARGLPVREPYPYRRQVPSAPRPGRLPHVLVVAMESFNAGMVEARTGDGRPITPTLDRLLGEGLYVEHFYANSTQTTQAQLSILCSILPGLWRKVLVAYPELRLHCLPRLLADRGYRSFFFSGQNDLDYDDTRAAMLRLGFAEVRTVDGEPDQDLWGWGWQDDRLYRELFARLDRDTLNDARPTFSFISTIAHHYTFNMAPHHQRRLVPEPTSFHEHFLNSINMADRFLGTLFEELRRRPVFRDSIVVLVGDHGFPTGLRGVPYNEVGASDEIFRVPLLVLWPGHLRPARVRGRAHSQIDIAPTLLGLLGVGGQQHFIGRSLLDPPDPARAVPLIQPFDGLYLGAVRWPFKVLRRQRTGEERLFDLEHDPDELRSLAARPELRGELEGLRRELPAIFLNQRLLDANRIWPGP